MDGLREELPGLGDQAGQDVQANGGVAGPAGRAQPGEAVGRFVGDLAAVVAGEGCGQLAGAGEGQGRARQISGPNMRASNGNGEGSDLPCTPSGPAAPPS